MQIGVDSFGAVPRPTSADSSWSAKQ